DRVRCFGIRAEVPADIDDALVIAIGDVAATVDDRVIDLPLVQPDVGDIRHARLRGHGMRDADVQVFVVSTGNAEDGGMPTDAMLAEHQVERALLALPIDL